MASERSLCEVYKEEYTRKVGGKQGKACYCSNKPNENMPTQKAGAFSKDSSEAEIHCNVLREGLVPYTSQILASHSTVGGCPERVGPPAQEDTLCRCAFMSSNVKAGTMFGFSLSTECLLG